MRHPTRPLYRCLFAYLSAASAALFLAACLLWARSYWVRDELSVARGGWAVRFGSGGGVGDADWTPRWPGRRVVGPLRWSTPLRPGIGGRELTRARVRALWTFSYAAATELVATSPVATPTPHYRVNAPLWVLLPPTVAAPVAWLRRHRTRTRRAKLGQCPRCGYDLRGNVSGVCPECGTPVTPATTTQGNA